MKHIVHLIFIQEIKKLGDFEIRVINQTGIYAVTENLFAYGIKNDGIYVINADTMQTNKIVESKGECVINKIENNIIFYDDASIQI